MRLWVAAFLLVTACSSAPQQGALSLPSPPTGVLASWKNFPADANPRPIVAFEDTVEHIQRSGFGSSERKLAWLCNRFVFASGVTVSDTVPTKAVAGGVSYRAISSARAYNDLIGIRSREGQWTGCASLAPFVITAVRWHEASFATDRGTLSMSAWLFDIPTVDGYVGHSAVDPSAFWGGRLAIQGRGAGVSSDGRTLKVTVADPGTALCESQYTTSTVESNTAVALSVKAIPHLPPSPVTCPLVLKLGFISIALNAPLGGRVLLDEEGKVGVACFEHTDCQPRL